MRVLVVTRIFPNAVEPLWGPYNRQQFAALSRLCEVDVLAVIPWFPGARLLGRRTLAGRLLDVPARETIEGLDVVHPRVLYVPTLHTVAGLLYAASLAPAFLRRRGKFDVILGVWAYPDGAAAVALGELTGVPTVIKVHGSDINTIAEIPGPRRNLRWALPRARRVVAVSRPLAERVAALGAHPDRIDVIQDGVDASLFRPRDRAGVRAELGHGHDDRRWFLFVGRLENPKGMAELLTAFEELAARRRDVCLVLVGDGPEQAACRALAARLPGRVILAGPRPHDEVASWMAASDVLVLPSWAEGTPSVIIEALACGRRIVASTVGGIPDLVNRTELGELVPPRDAAALRGALDRAAVDYDAEVVARVAARGGWDESARALHRSLVAATAS